MIVRSVGHPFPDVAVVFVAYLMVVIAAIVFVFVNAGEPLERIEPVIMTCGVHVAPANVTLRNVLDLTHQTTNGEQDILNPIGINVIRPFPGEGIRVMGDRTLTNTFDGRHYVHIRRLLNFDKISISRALRRFLFKGIQPRLFSRIERAISAFHRNLWRQGALYPNNDFSSAHFVKCDEENNPIESRRLGKLYVDAGINPPFPAEFIIFRIGLYDGETAVEEVVS